MKKKLIFSTITIFIIGVSIFLFNKINYYYSNDLLKVELTNKNNIVITLAKNNKSFCQISNTLDENKWVKVNDNICTIDYTNATNKIYIKNIFGKIFEFKNKTALTKVTSLEIKNSKIYLAINGIEKLNYIYDTLGDVKEKVEFKSENPSIATVTNEGIVKGILKGTTNIIVKYKNLEDSIEVVVTDMITSMPDEFNYDRNYLSCNLYTKEENDFLDEVLSDRVEDAGYKTRAGVVAAARFLMLEFPYRLNYFAENGRLDGYGGHLYVDGEGRYYKKGLYLNSSRYENIISSFSGPGTWGCGIYSIPAEKYIDNGLDCSGFVTWVLYNGGFEPGDVGAGVSYTPDLTDLGEKIWIIDSISNNKIKAGDLLSGTDSTGGHIALVAGMDEENYYVAESLWWGTGYVGPIIRTYKKEDLSNYFYWHVDMDNYFVEDGNYTEYWNN